ncbi:MAG: glycosyltransferase family 2 protein, partial [Ignavibacteria bacterium]|nr:glycosyltransferase family 2 protein [Ignavibacteria bacterium]
GLHALQGSGYMDILTGVFWAFGIVIFLFGLQSLFFFPLTLYYEYWKRQRSRQFDPAFAPFVSVIVPAYNEQNTIARSIASVLHSDYQKFEVIVVNDGSTDGTEEELKPLLCDHRVVYIGKPNGGKASALNTGIAASHGEIIFFTDADSLLRPDTLRNIVRWFIDPGIHAVCGDDTPIEPATFLQKLLTITTHIGTGFVRRAFSVLNVMPIISGNCGAVRKEYLDKVGGFTEIWGEDLDLTFKLHRARARIVYDWEALVFCEVPRTAASLWSQRVRWLRSFIKITRLHSDVMFNRQFFPFSFYLPLNWFNLIVIPVLQLLALIILAIALPLGITVFNGILDVLAFSGILFFFGIASYSILIDRQPLHLMYLPFHGWLIIPFSYFLNAVVVYALYRETRQSSEVWHKIERRTLQSAPSPRNGLRLSPFRISFGVVTVASAIVFFGLQSHHNPNGAAAHPARPLLTVATHFDAWETPSEAMTSVVDRRHLNLISTLAVGAGRYEWNFFRWKDHEHTWSNDQRNSDADLLESVIEAAGDYGKRVIAIVDFFAPTYIAQHPDAAAVESGGRRSSEQVCFTELTEGVYGDHLRQMIGYLSNTYDLEGISLTELDYQRYCYCPRCLRSFSRATGERDWPRSISSGAPDRFSERVGTWRSEMMSGFLRSLADSAHAYGRKLYIDVPVDYDDMQAQGLYHGLEYPRLLTFADGLIVWDYFSLAGRGPAESEQVSRFFTERYGAKNIILSIGLWGNGTTITPDEFGEAIRSSLNGGAQQIWVTPNHLISRNHWDRMTRVLGMQ